jgi:AcrR family transcriptional regulator
MGTMGRWEPDARGRLLRAAIDLFTERGYDATTAAQIAERAGLTKTTLFRHFADKREILFQGQEILIRLAADGVRAAEPQSASFDVLRAGVLALCTVHEAEHRQIGRQLDAIFSSSPELRERAAFKRSAITDALQKALAARFGDERRAAVLADIGVRAYYDGFAAWIASAVDGPLADVVSNELAAYASVLVDMAPSPVPSPSLGSTSR